MCFCVRVLLIILVFANTGCRFGKFFGKKYYTAKPSRSKDFTITRQLQLEGIYLARIPDSGFMADHSGTRHAEHFALALYVDGTAKLYKFAYEHESDTTRRYRPWEDSVNLASFLEGKLSDKPYLSPHLGGFKIDSSNVTLQLFQYYAHGDWGLTEYHATIQNDSTLFVTDYFHPPHNISEIYSIKNYHFRFVRTAKPNYKHILLRKKWFWKDHKK